MSKWLEIVQSNHTIQAKEHDVITEKITQTQALEKTERTRSHFIELCALLDMLSQKKDFLDQLNIIWNIENGIIRIHPKHSADDTDEIISKHIPRIITLLSPWRKGPFSIFDMSINAEWNSYLKWERLQSIFSIDTLCRHKNILDVGCSNAYYSFHMLAAGANMVLGIDPMPRNAMFAELYQLLLPSLNFYYELWGVEDCAVLPTCFDTIFCMGILYHQRNPLLMLETIRQSLKKNGLLVLESICLNNTSPYCLVPQDRYMKSKGYWFIPSIAVLKTWLYKAGFEILAYDVPVKTAREEQQYTEWIRGESLEHFLDEKDENVTVEGYPAPYRMIIVAQRRF